jgi:hypothetical protein
MENSRKTGAYVQAVLAFLEGLAVAYFWTERIVLSAPLEVAGYDLIGYADLFFTFPVLILGFLLFLFKKPWGSSLLLFVIPAWYFYGNQTGEQILFIENAVDHSVFIAHMVTQVVGLLAIFYFWKDPHSGGTVRVNHPYRIGLTALVTAALIIVVRFLEFADYEVLVVRTNIGASFFAMEGGIIIPLLAMTAIVMLKRMQSFSPLIIVTSGMVIYHAIAQVSNGVVLGNPVHVFRVVVSIFVIAISLYWLASCRWDKEHVT